MSMLNMLIATIKRLDAVQPNISGPTNCSEEFRRGWHAALSAAWAQAQPARELIARFPSAADRAHDYDDVHMEERS